MTTVKPQNTGHFSSVPWVSLIPRFHCSHLAVSLFTSSHLAVSLFTFTGSHLAVYNPHLRGSCIPLDVNLQLFIDAKRYHCKPIKIRRMILFSFCRPHCGPPLHRSTASVCRGGENVLHACCMPL